MESVIDGVVLSRCLFVFTGRLNYSQTFFLSACPAADMWQCWQTRRGATCTRTLCYHSTLGGTPPRNRFLAAATLTWRQQTAAARWHPPQKTQIR